MVKMTKAQCRKRLMESVSKLNKVLDSRFILYEVPANDARAVRDARDALIKIVKKLSR